MDEEIKEELQKKNEEMFLNKKKIDIDKSMESFIMFYENYFNTTIPNEMTDRICQLHGISKNSEQGMAFYNMITTFFRSAFDELKNSVNTNVESLKKKIDNIPDEEYPKVLSRLSVAVINNMSDYFLGREEMLNKSYIKNN